MDVWLVVSDFAVHGHSALLLLGLYEFAQPTCRPGSRQSQAAHLTAAGKRSPACTQLARFPLGSS